MNEPTSSPLKRSNLSRENRQARRAQAANRRANLLLVLIPVAFALGLFTGYLYWGRLPGTNPTQAGVGNGNGVDSQAQPEKRYNVSTDDDPSMGAANAKVTIIEFSDYQCPYCQKWHQEVYARLLQNYGDKIRFVYRDFPLTSIHPEAQPAAEAADCAGDQGKYWGFADKLFSGQYNLGQQAFQQYASDLKLDLNKFNECVSSRRFQKEVEADLSYATSLGVSSTPTFFINGLAVVGAQPYEVFQQVIDKELQGGAQ